MKDFKEYYIANYVSTNEDEIIDLSENSKYNINYSMCNMNTDFIKKQSLMFSPSLEIKSNIFCENLEFKRYSNTYNNNMEMNFESQVISDFALKFDTEIYNKSHYIENEFLTNKDTNPEYRIFSNENLFQKNEENVPEDEKVPDIITIPKKSLLKKKLNKSSKFESQQLNLEKSKEFPTKSSKKRKNELQKLKPIKFEVIQITNYLRSGNNTKKISFRLSNCINKILRNLFQNIYIDWISIQSKSKLKKLSKNCLEVIYIRYKVLKNVKLEEIYSGNFFEKIDKEIFEENKKVIEESSLDMKNKLDYIFQEAYNSFYNKKECSTQNDDILNGLKSKNEYIKEHNKYNNQGVKKLFEKAMKSLFNSINDEKA